MKAALSRIYFDDKPVKLMDDESRPSLDSIVRAGGLSPGRVDVVVLAARRDPSGHVLRPGEVIDRTVEPAKPIYLRSVPKALPADGPATNRDAVIAQLGTDPAERKAGRDRRLRERDDAAAQGGRGGPQPPLG